MTLLVVKILSVFIIVINCAMKIVRFFSGKVNLKLKKVKFLLNFLCNRKGCSFLLGDIQLCDDQGIESVCVFCKYCFIQRCI